MRWCALLEVLRREPLQHFVNVSGATLPAGSVHLQGEAQPTLAPLESPFGSRIWSALSTQLRASLLDEAFSLHETDERVHRALIGSSRPKTIVVLGT